MEVGFVLEKIFQIAIVFVCYAALRMNLMSFSFIIVDSLREFGCVMQDYIYVLFLGGWFKT